MMSRLKYTDIPGFSSNSELACMLTLITDLPDSKGSILHPAADALPYDPSVPETIGRDHEPTGISYLLLNIVDTCQGAEKIRSEQYQVTLVLPFNLVMERATHGDQNITLL